VAYRVRSTWNAGFTADVRVTNTGGVGVSDWTLTFALTGDQRILQGWNGVFGQAGPDVTVADAGYNGKLPPGRSTTVGFNGSYRRRNPAPARFRLNGVPCSVNAG
jgi:cellulase/cellobiase CelA1